MKVNFMVQYITNYKITYDYEDIDIFELYYNFVYNLKNSLDYIQNYRDDLLINDKQRNNRQRNGGRL